MEQDRKVAEHKAKELKEKGTRLFFNGIFLLGNRELERQIEKGKITFDHEGKPLAVKHQNADKFPQDFRNLMSHNADMFDVKRGAKKLKIKNVKPESAASAENDFYRAKGNT